MKKIVVINSFGPIGSTVIASIIEHLNYLNFHTMRKVGLNEYLINLKSLEDDFMKNNVIRKLSSFSENQITGGVSVLDRNKQSPKKRYDLNKVADELNVYKKKKYTSIKNLYFDSYEIFNKATIYKPKKNNPKGVIELTNNIYKIEASKLYENYTNEFETVFFINIKRNFINWLNSFASQYYSYPNLSRKNFFFRVSAILKQFKKYEEKVELFKGLNIEFNEIFLPNTNLLLDKICNFLQEEKNLKWNDFEYDLYGSLKNYKETFTKFDDSVYFLPKIFFKIFNRLNKYYFKNFLIDFTLDVIFQIIYLIGYFNFKKNYK